MSIKKLVILAGLCLLLISPLSCSPAVVETQTVSDTSTPLPLQLSPYHTLTPTSTALPPDPATATPLPTATATPRFHTVESGQDMYGIAYLYGISVQELLAANPDVNPNLMSVGQELTIPATTSGTSETGTLPSPTPGGVTLGEVSCYQAEDKSAWCFVAANNPLGVAAESISARIRIALESGEVLTETASPLLNLAPTGSIMPLIAYYNPLSSELTGANVELVSALPVSVEEERYLSLHSENQEINIAEDAKSVGILGQVFLEGSAPASEVWVGGIAFDEQGRIVGVKRWESPGGLAPGEALTYDLRVYSAGGKISRVSVLLEAHP